jgi:hypothetical protein
MLPSDLDVVRLRFGRRLPDAALLLLYEFAWHLLFGRAEDVVYGVAHDSRVGGDYGLKFFVPQRVLAYIPLDIDVEAYARDVGIGLLAHFPAVRTAPMQRARWVTLNARPFRVESIEQDLLECIMHGVLMHFLQEPAPRPQP